MKTFWAILLFAAVAGAQETVDVDGRNVRVRVEGIGSPAVMQIREKRIDDALKFFSANVELFPDDANVYDSVAAAYALKGDRAAALANYRNSLQMDPRNTNAAQWIAKLEKAKE